MNIVAHYIAKCKIVSFLFNKPDAPLPTTSKQNAVVKYREKFQVWWANSWQMWITLSRIVIVTKESILSAVDHTLKFYLPPPPILNLKPNIEASSFNPISKSRTISILSLCLYDYTPNYLVEVCAMGELIKKGYNIVYW